MSIVRLPLDRGCLPLVWEGMLVAALRLRKPARRPVSPGSLP